MVLRRTNKENKSRMREGIDCQMVQNHLLLLAIPNPPFLVVTEFLWESKLGFIVSF